MGAADERTTSFTSRMNSMRTFSATIRFLLCLVPVIYGALSAVRAQPGPKSTDELLVPGESIGKVRLGMTRQTVHQLLSAPRSSQHMNDGTLLERWANRKPSHFQLGGIIGA